MVKATFDPARELTLYFRCNRNGSLDFIFQYEDETAYSLIYEDIEFNLYQNQGDKKKVLNLTSGSGVSFPNTGTARVTLTASQTNINEGEYYFELYRPDLGKTWLCGNAIAHNGKFDGVTADSTVTVSENGDQITITIHESGLTRDDLNTRVVTVESTSTLTPDIDNYDLFEITAQAAAITVAAPTGTPVNGNVFVIRITDNGTGRAITWNGIYRAFNVALPTNTTANKTLYVAICYNSNDTRYDVVGVIEEV